MRKLFACIMAAAFLASCSRSAEETNTENGFSAIETLNQQIQDDPNNAALYHERARLQMDKRFYDAALKDISRALLLDSTQADFYYSAGEAYFRINQTRQSKDAFEKCVQLNPDHVDALLKLGELYLYVEGYKKSIEYLDRALKVDKHLARAYMMKGLDFKLMGDTARALSSFQTAVEQDPDYYDAYMQLGLIHSAKRNPLAVDYYNNALRVDPVSVEAQYGKAMFFQENGDINQALEVYNAILAVNAGHTPTHYNLGYIYAEHFKKYPIAIGFFEDAIKADSTYLKARYMRGYCQEKMGYDDRAAEDYTWVLHRDSRFEPASEGLRRLGF